MMASSHDARAVLLEAGLWFIRAAAELPGVRRIGLIGSILTDRRRPKDIDLVVQVADDLDLAPLAALGRRLKGRLLSAGSGADVFLVNERGSYIGRTCRWVRCRPGVRASCPALHCGRRPHVCDDFTVVRLDDVVVAEPPVEVWPAVVRHVPVPADVEQMLGNLTIPPNNRLKLAARGRAAADW
jgi:predicted nucleotidyltransferase